MVKGQRIVQGSEKITLMMHDRCADPPELIHG